MENKKTVNMFIIWTFIGALLFGIICLFISTYWLEDSWQRIVEGIGIALLTASIVGGIIELAFVTQLAKKVFEIAFGYLLRDEIKDEVKWVYEMGCIAIDYKHDIEIEKTDNPKQVRVFETISRTFKNIGEKDIDIEPNFGIQEWFYSERSEIISYTLTHGGNIYSFDNKHIEVVRSSDNSQKNYILGVKGKDIKDKLGRKKDEYFTVIAKEKEIKNVNDQSLSFFSIASLNPYVTVQLPPDMDVDVTFANRKNQKLEYLGGNNYRLNSLLLPGQALRIRWWLKSDSEKWCKEIDE